MIFQGIQQSIGPISLSEPHEDTGILLIDLPSAWQIRTEETIPANSLDHAQQIVDNLGARVRTMPEVRSDRHRRIPRARSAREEGAAPRAEGPAPPQSRAPAAGVRVRHHGRRLRARAVRRARSHRTADPRHRRGRLRAHTGAAHRAARARVAGGSVPRAGRPAAHGPRHGDDLPPRPRVRGEPAASRTRTTASIS